MIKRKREDKPSSLKKLRKETKESTRRWIFMKYAGKYTCHRVISIDDIIPFINDHNPSPRNCDCTIEWIEISDKFAPSLSRMNITNDYLHCLHYTRKGGKNMFYAVLIC